jgi:hypothetical protein
LADTETSEERQRAGSAGTGFSQISVEHRSDKARDANACIVQNAIVSEPTHD